MTNNRFERIYDVEEINTGDLLLTVDQVYNESLEVVECIDNGFIFTVDRTGAVCKEEADTFVQDYAFVYRIKP